MSDKDFSPRPDSGKWFLWTKRPTVRVEADPQYGPYSINDIKTFNYWIGEHWFFSWDIAGLWHGYIGDRPITLEDPQFYWRELPTIKALWKNGNLFSEFRWRIGVGDW